MSRLPSAFATRSPRILHFIKGLGLGGAEQLLPATLRFATPGLFSYEYAYVLRHKTALVGALRHQGAVVTPFDITGNAGVLLVTRRVARHLKERHIDLIHCHLPMTGVIGRVAARIAGIPVVYTEHNTQEQYRPLTRRLNLFTWRWQDRVIAVSNAVAQSAARHGARGIPVQVIVNGVDADAFQRGDFSSSHIRDTLGIPAGAPVIGTVAVFRREKRLQDWLRAAALVHEHHAAARFIIVGDGPLRSELEALASELGLAGHVHFAGLQPDVRPYLAMFDVFLMSSEFEGLPIALLEAMAMECAVVATSAGGTVDVLDDGRNGCLAPVGAPGDLAARVMSLIDDAPRRAALARAARERVVSSFTVARMMEQVERVYADVLGLA